MIKNKNAFTLIELIVVVVILSILWTIAFISIQEYSSDSRNSVRITDLWIIKQSLWLFEINWSKYPLPSNSTWVIYSWSLLWTQWFFWDTPFSNLANISRLPIDPLYEIEYNYSVLRNNRKFQLWTIIEWSLFSNNNSIVWDTYALWNSNIISYVTWNYTAKDIASISWNNCNLLTVPSLNISNLPTDWILQASWQYSFIFSDSSNISKNYTERINNTFQSNTFTIKEMWNNCSINTIDELNLYISRLSLTYQQLVWNKMFDETIYNFNTTSFKRWTLDELISNWIKVNSTLMDSIMNPTVWNIFRDTFTWVDNIDISNTHTPDTYWNWQGDNSYWIASNRLTKTLDSSGFISPIPTLPITSIDRTILFDLVDFAWWSIFIYTNYTDVVNYQWVELKPTWYIRKKWN